MAGAGVGARNVLDARAPLKQYKYTVSPGLLGIGVPRVDNHDGAVRLQGGELGRVNQNFFATYVHGGPFEWLTLNGHTNLAKVVPVT